MENINGMKTMICFVLSKSKQNIFHIAKGSLKELKRKFKGAKDLIQLSEKNNMHLL